METFRYRQHGLTIAEHRLNVPLDHSNPSRSIELFAREITRPGGEDLPRLLFLQGGPGGEGPRLGDFHDGWIGHALKDHRVVLMDQRGTGQSTPVFSSDLSGEASADARYLSLFLQDQIIADAEMLREALEEERWVTLGQSYGGFLTLAYLSLFPQALSGSYVTGGLPGLVPIDDIYRLTYPLTAHRNREFFSRYPRDEKVVREVAAHLHGEEVILPGGDRLTPARFRSVGQALGMAGGFDTLHYLFEGPFIHRHGEKILSPAFLAAVENRTSVAARPLYYALQEAIYLPTTPGGTRWSAQRLAEEFPGFAAEADPLDGSDPWFLTGEHVSRAMIEEDADLAPFLPAMDLLAEGISQPPIYNASALAENSVPVTAAVYFDDMFVPRELSMQTAHDVGHVRTWVTSEYQHDGLRASGSKVFEHLVSLSTD